MQLSQKVDSFEVNVRDERFSALYSNHLYAPDPAHPHYRYVPVLSEDVVYGSVHVSRETKAMTALMKECRKRRERCGATGSVTTPTSDHDKGHEFTDPRSLYMSANVRVCIHPPPHSLSPSYTTCSVSQLMKAVKSKTQSLKERKKRKKKTAANI